MTKVTVRTLYIREGKAEIEANEALTVRELKRRVAHKLHISPRKLMTLRWWGAVMDDEKTLDECHVADGGLLELSLKNHAQAELDALKDVRQVRVRVASGSMVVVDEVSNATPPAPRKPSPKLTLTQAYPDPHNPSPSPRTRALATEPEP